MAEALARDAGDGMNTVGTMPAVPQQIFKQEEGKRILGTVSEQDVLLGVAIGMFYGEGSVAPEKPRIAFYNTDRRALLAVQKVLGAGNVREVKTKSPLSKKRQFILEISDKVGLETTAHILLRVRLMEPKARLLEALLRKTATMRTAKNRNALQGLTKERLLDLYDQQGQTVKAIADRYHVHRSSVHERMERMGIPRRTRGPRHPRLRGVSPEALRGLYWADHLSTGTIAKRFRVSQSTIISRMRKQRIPFRSRSEAALLREANRR